MRKEHMVNRILQFNGEQGSQSQQFSEEVFLLSLLREDWNGVHNELQRKDIDHQRFHKILKNAGVGAYIDWLIESDGRQDLFPGELLEIFKNARKKAKIDNSYILGILDKVIDAAEARKIEVMLLKGADLIHRVYRSSELRHLDDIDLLIHHSNLDEFIKLLSELDFAVPAGKELDYFRRASYNLECWTKSLFPCLFEVHWNLSQRFRYRVDMEEVWKSSQSNPQLPKNVRLMGREDLFIHLLLHIFHHSFHPQLKWYVDLKELIRIEKIDFNDVLAKSSAWGCRYSVHYSLLFLEKLFPSLVPKSYLMNAKISRLRDYFISKFYSDSPIRFLDSGGNKLAERMVRTIGIDKISDMILFSLHRILKNPWIHFERE